MFRFLSLLAFGFSILLSPAAVAFEEVNTGYFNNLALKGYDSAGYFTDRSAREGSTSFIFNWKGTEWRFADQKSRDLFAATPESYAPQYGGYCSNQMSLGNLSDIDPGVWLIFEDKLFFFGHQAGKDRWERTGIAERIADADQNWKAYLSGKE